MFAEVSVSSGVAYQLPITPVVDRTAAIRFFEERVRRNPSGGLDLAELAGSYLAHGKRMHDHQWLARAEDAARRSIANLDVGNTKADLVLAMIAQERHDFSGALAIANRILATRPRHIGALGIATTSNIATGNLAAALEAAELWVSEQATQLSLAHRAVIHAAAGRDQLAAADFASAIEAEQAGQVEASAWTRAMLGRFHFRRGRTIAARVALREALRITPTSVLPKAELAELEARAGSGKEAQRLYLELHQATAQPVWLAKIASVVAARGDRARASALWATSISAMRADLEHGHDDHRRHLVNALLARGERADLAEALELATQDASIRRDAETVLSYTWALARTDQLERARRVLASALTSGHADPRLYQRAAEVERRLHRDADARGHLHRARALAAFVSDRLASIERL